MARRVFAIKVVRNQDVTSVRLIGRSDRGQPGLLAHAHGKAGKDPKKTTGELMLGAFEVLKGNDS